MIYETANDQHVASKIYYVDLAGLSGYPPEQKDDPDACYVYRDEAFLSRATKAELLDAFLKNTLVIRVTDHNSYLRPTGVYEFESYLWITCQGPEVGEMSFKVVDFSDQETV